MKNMINLDKKRTIHQKVLGKLQTEAVCKKIEKIEEKEIENTAIINYSKKLNPEQKKFLKKQAAIFNKLRNIKKIKNNKIEFNEFGELIFEAGTLFHGTSSLPKEYKEKIDAIEKTGILAIGTQDENEIPYCAGFFKAEKELSFLELSKALRGAYKTEDFTCFDRPGSRSIVFVINPSKTVGLLSEKDLLKKEFDNTNEREILQTSSLVVKEHIEKRNKGESNISMAAIPCGIPSNFFSGIVVGSEWLSNDKMIKYLVDKFPHCYVVSPDGEFLYIPGKKDEEGRFLKAKERSYGHTVVKKIKEGWESLKNTPEQNKKFLVDSQEQLKIFLEEKDWTTEEKNLVCDIFLPLSELVVLNDEISKALPDREWRPDIEGIDPLKEAIIKKSEYDKIFNDMRKKVVKAVYTESSHPKKLKEKIEKIIGWD